MLPQIPHRMRHEQPLHIVTKDGTGITSVVQLKGKHVSVGAPNSGTEEQAGYVLKALGIDWDKDFKREKLGAGESVAALKDGKIDAFFWSGAVPTGAIIDMASTRGIKMVLLPVGGETADRIMKANPGVFHKTVFPKGSYAGVERDIDAIAITGRPAGDGHLPGGPALPDPEGDLRQQGRTGRGVERGQCADAAEGGRSGDPGCDEIPPSGRAEVFHGNGRAEIRPDAGLRQRGLRRRGSRRRASAAGWS
jgi:NMT1-like family